MTITDIYPREKEKTIVKKKEKKGLSTKTINIIRTTQRNNIELTSIADYKANVLLSLNAFMLTCIVPYVFANTEDLIESYMAIPMLITSITCFLTVYKAAEVLKPSDFDRRRKGSNEEAQPSPFFFGNFYKMEPEEYYLYLEEGLANDNLIKAHLSQDLYYIGRRLGFKMSNIRSAFNIFIAGIFCTLLATVIVLAIA